MPNLFETADTEQQEIEREADDIASSITKILVDAFKAKENRDPTADELDMLLSELTEERIAEMLGEAFVPTENASGDDEGSDPEDEQESDEDGEEVEVHVVEVEEPVEVIPEVKSSLTNVVSVNNLNENTEDGESAAKKRKLDTDSETPDVLPSVV